MSKRNKKGTKSVDQQIQELRTELGLDELTPIEKTIINSVGEKGIIEIGELSLKQKGISFCKTT